MHVKKHLQNQDGIGLIEVVAAFGISIVVITSLVSLALYTTRSSLNSKLLLEGTKIASREIERVRAYRDKSVSWTQFLDDLDPTDGDGVDCSAKCTMSADSDSITSGESSETIDNQVVTRYFSVTPDETDSSNIVRITVEVSWSLGGVTKSTHVYTDLTNWQPK